MKKATRIEIRYDDGSMDLAEGSDAAQILDWYNAGQTMNLIHGAVYSGPQFKEIAPRNEERSGNGSK